MNANNEDSLLSAFRLAAGSTEQGLESQLQALTTQLGSLQAANQSQATLLAQNTQAVLQSTTAQTSTSSVVSSTLGSGLSLVPIIGGLLSLFGGGSSTTTTTPEEYVAPDSLDLALGFSDKAGGQIGTVDYGQTGTPRLLSADTTSTSVLDYLQQSALGQQSSGTAAGSSGGASASSYSPQITIQVQAMDSRSILDHSDEIARAVREAMLSSNSLNDVITEL